MTLEKKKKLKTRPTVFILPERGCKKWTTTYAARTPVGEGREEGGSDKMREGRKVFP